MTRNVKTENNSTFKAYGSLLRADREYKMLKWWN